MAPKGPIGPRFDLTGKRFGRLTALEPVHFKHKGKWKLVWRCRCSCGNEVQAGTANLIGGLQSCGCARVDAIVKTGHANRVHGEKVGGRSTPEYRSWIHMRYRCLRSKKGEPSYRYWRGRGIGICKRWSKYENFLADMGRRPGPGYSLGRIDNDKDYSPANCRWETDSQQNGNRRMTRKRKAALLRLADRARGRRRPAWVRAKISKGQKRAHKRRRRLQRLQSLTS